MTSRGLVGITTVFFCQGMIDSRGMAGIAAITDLVVWCVSLLLLWCCVAIDLQKSECYLISVLSSSVQRRKRFQDNTNQRATATQQSVAHLEPSAFECIVRLCYATAAEEL